MVSVVSIFLVVACFAAALLFPVRYAWTTWRRTGDGWHTMVFSVALAALLGLVAAGRLFGLEHPAWELVRAVCWLLLLGVLVWRDVLLFQAQVRVRRLRRAEQGSDEEPTVDGDLLEDLVDSDR